MIKQRFKLTPAVFLLLEKDKKILLQRRFNTGWEDGNYSLISGHLDGDESATCAMIREAKEEAGIIVSSCDLKVVHVTHRKTENIDNERVDIFFKASKWCGKPKIAEKDKSDDLRWFSTGKLPANIIPVVKNAIENYRKGVVFSEFGWDN